MCEKTDLQRNIVGRPSVRRPILILIALVAAYGTAVAAQFQFFDFRPPEPPTRNIPYDGQFTFAIPIAGSQPVSSSRTRPSLSITTAIRPVSRPCS